MRFAVLIATPFLPQMKKKPNKQVTPSWHPNFRIVEGLPDIKVIRTDFLINSAGILIPLILIGILIHSHVTESTLKTRIADLNEIIAERDPQNNRFLQQNRTFNDEAKKLNEVSGFLTQGMDPVALLIDFVELRPEFIAYRNINVRRENRQISKKTTAVFNVVTLTGSLRGSASEELLQMDAFADQLRNHPQFGHLVDKVETTVQRNVAADVFDFTMNILIKDS